MLRVAASMTVAEYLLPGWLTALRGCHPETAVTLAAGYSADVAAVVLSGAADIGFVEGPDPAAGTGRPAGRTGHAHRRGPRAGLRDAALPGRGAGRPGRP